MTNFENSSTGKALGVLFDAVTSAIPDVTDDQMGEIAGYLISHRVTVCRLGLGQILRMMWDARSWKAFKAGIRGSAEKIVGRS